MSSDNDKCFQCQETGHMALTSDALTVTIIDMLQQIAPTKSHLQAHQQDTGTKTLVGMTDQHLRVITTPGITTMTIGIGTGLVDLNLPHITLDIGVTVTVIPAEVAVDPFTGPHPIAHHATGAQAHTCCYVGQYRGKNFKISLSSFCCLGIIYCILYCVLRYTTAHLQVHFSLHHLGRITKDCSNNYNSESFTLYLHLLTLHNCTVT